MKAHSKDLKKNRGWGGSHQLKWICLHYHTQYFYKRFKQLIHHNIYYILQYILYNDV